jgi:hypothetical protein
MTIKATGFLKFSEIGTEAKVTLLQPVAFNNVELRKLAAKITDKSQISALDFYGRTYGVGSGYVGADFGSYLNQAPLTVTTSAKVFGPGDCSMAIFCDQPAEYRINDGIWTDKSILGSLVPDDYVEVRVTTAPTYGTQSDVTVNMGGTIKVFAVATGASKISYIGITMSGVLITEDPHGTVYSRISRGGTTNAAAQVFSSPPDGYTDRGAFSGTNNVFSGTTTNSVITQQSTYVWRYTFPAAKWYVTIEHLASDTITGSTSGTANIVWDAYSTGKSTNTTVSVNIGTLNGKAATKMQLYIYTYVSYGSQNTATLSFI